MQSRSRGSGLGWIAVRPTWVRRVWVVAALSAACVGDKGVAPALRSTTLTLGTATVSPTNAVMAVGQTVQLSVTGRSLSGDVITDFDSVQYSLQTPTDTLRIQLTSAGRITALAPTGYSTPVIVNVVPFKDGLAKGDQAIIQVTQTAIAEATLSIQPVPPDSAKLAQGNGKTIVPFIGNLTRGESVDNPTIRYRVNGADVKQLGFYAPNFSTATLTANQLYQFTCFACVGLNQTYAVGNTGQAWLYADVDVYGTMLYDSVQYTLTNPYSAFVYLSDLGLAVLNAQPTVFISPGGTVQFYNAISAAYGTQVTYTFADPSAATPGDASGNVVGLNSGESSSRRFLTAGTYTWTAMVSGSAPPFTGVTAAGRIVVQ